MIAIRNRLYSTLLGGSIGLPKCNLIFNWKTGSDEKVAGNTPKVLYPCFSGNGGHNVIFPFFRFNGTKFISFSTVIQPYDGAEKDYHFLGKNNTWHYFKVTTKVGDYRFGFEDSVALGTFTYIPQSELNIGNPIDITIGFEQVSGGKKFYVIINNGSKHYGSRLYDNDAFVKFNGFGILKTYNIFDSTMWNVNFNNEIHYPLIGHAYGFTSTGFSTGTPSDDSCFTGLCEYNPEEGYNNAPDGNDNLVIPQSHTDPTKDVLGADLVDFLGGNAIAAPYCKVDFEQVKDLGDNLVDKVDEDFDATKTITLNANLTSGNTYKVSYEMREAGTALEVSGDLTTTNIDFSLGWHTVEISAVNTGNSVTFTMTGGKIRNLSIQEVLSADNEPTNLLPFKRTNTEYNDLDNLTYEGFDPANVYRWNATELMRGVEWIKSLQPDWHIFMKIRDEDKVPLQIVAYKLPEIDYAQRLKVLKATKDKVTDVTDYALYINGNSAMLNQTGVPAEVGDTVSKIHSISNELIVSQTDETKQMTLTDVGLKGVYGPSPAKTYYQTSHRMSDSDHIYMKFKTSNNITDAQLLFGVCGSSWNTRAYYVNFGSAGVYVCLRNTSFPIREEALLQNTIYELEIFKVSNISWTVKFGEENNMIIYDGVDFSGGDDPINLDMILGAYNRNGVVKNSFDGEIIEFKLKKGE